MSNGLILIIDDEAPLRRLLEINLESQGYKTLSAENAREGIALAASHQPDLILLDLGLPDRSGLEVLDELRRWFQRAILILSAQNEEEGIVAALDKGAADYIAKPFRSAELLARIRSAIRKSENGSAEAILQSGPFVLNQAAHSLYKNGQLISLTSTEFQLMGILMQNQGRVLTYPQLLKAVWGPAHQNETQYLRVFIGNLRKKIETKPEAPEHILTENRIGYRFVGSL